MAEFQLNGSLNGFFVLESTQISGNRFACQVQGNTGDRQIIVFSRAADGSVRQVGAPIDIDDTTAPVNSVRLLPSAGGGFVALVIRTDASDPTGSRTDVEQYSANGTLTGTTAVSGFLSFGNELSTTRDPLQPEFWAGHFAETTELVLLDPVTLLPTDTTVPHPSTDLLFDGGFAFRLGSQRGAITSAIDINSGGPIPTYFDPGSAFPPSAIRLSRITAGNKIIETFMSDRRVTGNPADLPDFFYRLNFSISPPDAPAPITVQGAEFKNTFPHFKVAEVPGIGFAVLIMAENTRKSAGEDIFRMAFAKVQLCDFSGTALGEVTIPNIAGKPTVSIGTFEVLTDPAHAELRFLVGYNTVAQTGITKGEPTGQIVTLDPSASAFTVGTDYGDYLAGLDLSDDLFGGAGDDVMDGHGGDDFLFGDFGDDLARGGAGQDSITGDEGNDGLTGGDGDDSLEGGAGNDVLEGDDGRDFLSGGADNDLLTAGLGRDTVTGNDGRDIVLGEGGDDILSGGLGDDFLDGDHGADLVQGDEGNDALSGGGGADTVSGGEGDDSVEGDGGDDAVTGGAGSDTVSGGDGNDQIFAAENLSGFETTGNLLNGDKGNDLLLGNQGDDILKGGEGGDLLFGDADTLGGGQDSLFGGDGNDTLDGGRGDDDLEGGKGQDVLRGSFGIDLLEGGGGKDRLRGGGGSDAFLFLDASDAGLGRQRDVIQDFAPDSDILDLDAIFSGAVFFIFGQAFTGTRAEVRYDGLTGIVEGDVNGDGVADFQIMLLGAPDLTLDNIVV